MVIPPGGVVERQSTLLESFPDADVTSAIRFIRRRALDGIDVEEVRMHVQLSRRSLERRFRQYIGHSPGDEIRRVRLDKAQELLRLTDMPLVEVALSSGFASLPYLSFAFKRHFGVSPSIYRRKFRLARDLGQ